MAKNYVFLYRLSSDTGFAPCVQEGLLTLSCCKGGQIRNNKPCNTGLRYWIGSKRNGIDYETDSVFVLGTYQNKFLYLAKIQEVVTMEQYFDSKGPKRFDQIYSLKNNRLKRNDHLMKEGVHTFRDDWIRDFAGKYVLKSWDYIYLGAEACYVEIVSKNNSKSRETKVYSDEIADSIISECQKFKDEKTHKPSSSLKILNFSRRCSK